MPEAASEQNMTTSERFWQLKRSALGGHPALEREIDDLSRRFHNIFFRDTDESLCSRAWRLRHTRPFWRGWVMAFGPRHCRMAYRKHWRGRVDPCRGGSVAPA